MKICLMIRHTCAYLLSISCLLCLLLMLCMLSERLTVLSNAQS